MSRNRRKSRASAIAPTQNGNGTSNDHAAGLSQKEEASKREDPEKQRNATVVDPVNRAVALLSADGAEFYTEFNYLLQIRRKAPEGDSQTPFTCEAGSDDAAIWIARVLYQAGLPQLTKREETQALAILSGLAQANRQAMDLPETVEDDPVTYTVGDLLASQPSWSGTATELRSLLMSMGEQSDTFGHGHPGWPLSAAMLTRRLRELTPVLAEMGIIHESRRYSWRRTHTLRRIVDTSSNGKAPHAEPAWPPAQNLKPGASSNPSHLAGASAAPNGGAVPKGPSAASSNTSSLPSSFANHNQHGSSADHDDSDDALLRERLRHARNTLASIKNGSAPTTPRAVSPQSSQGSSFVSRNENKPCGSNDDDDDSQAGNGHLHAAPRHADRSTPPQNGSADANRRPG